ncbi:MAG: FeoB-associated Cys-rich membrane protein [Christensenellales bacterium]|jgi:hypothetical protein
MFAFIVENLATIVVGLAILAIVVLIIARLIKNRKEGPCCGCAHGQSCDHFGQPEKD